VDRWPHDDVASDPPWRRGPGGTLARGLSGAGRAGGVPGRL